MYPSTERTKKFTSGIILEKQRGTKYGRKGRTKNKHAIS